MPKDEPVTPDMHWQRLVAAMRPTAQRRGVNEDTLQLLAMDAAAASPPPLPLNRAELFALKQAVHAGRVQHPALDEDAMRSLYGRLNVAWAAAPRP